MSNIRTTVPLTTFFTPSPSCWDLFVDAGSTHAVLNLDYLCHPGQGTNYAPPNILYSPGICPNGYVSAGAFSRTITGTVSDITLSSGEFGHRCCPIGYTTWSQHQSPSPLYLSFFDCRSDISPPTTASQNTNANFDRVVTIGGTDGTTIAMAYAIYVKWKSEDLRLFPSAVTASLLPMSTMTSPTATATAVTATASREVTTTPSPTTKSTALPTPTKIVLAILLPISLILLVIIVWLGLRQRRLSRNYTPRENTPGEMCRTDVLVPH